MKLDHHQKPPKDEIEIVDQKEIKKQLVQVGTIRLHPGHMLFEINTVTGSIRPAEYATVDADFRKAVLGTPSVNKKVIKKPDCIYIPALNKINAMKKMFGRFVELKKEGKL